ARVLALMGGEVDELRGLGDARIRGGDGDVDGDDEGDDGAVVRGVGRDVEDGGAVDGGNGVTNGGDDLGAAALAEVRHAFDELHQTLGFAGVRPWRGGDGTGGSRRRRALRSRVASPRWRRRVAVGPI